MNICTRSDFNELELVVGTCRFEDVCTFEGSCPMQKLTDEHYASLEPDIYCYAFGTAEECPDCLNNSCYEPCKAEGGVKND